MAEFPLYRSNSKPSSILHHTKSYRDLYPITLQHQNSNTTYSDAEETSIDHSFLRRDSSVSISALSSLVELDESIQLTYPQNLWETSEAIDTFDMLPVFDRQQAFETDLNTYSPTGMSSSPHFTDWQSLGSQTTSPIGLTHARPVFVKSHSASILPSDTHMDEPQITNPFPCSDDEFHISKLFPNNLVTLEPQSRTTEFPMGEVSTSLFAPRDFNLFQRDNSATELELLSPRILNRSPSWPLVAHPRLYRHNAVDQSHTSTKVKKKSGPSAAKALSKSQFIPSREVLDDTALHLQSPENIPLTKHNSFLTEAQQSHYIASAPSLQSSLFSHSSSSSRESSRTYTPISTSRPISQLASSRKRMISSPEATYRPLACRIMSRTPSSPPLVSGSLMKCSMCWFFIND
ncbi:hypothetical protein NEOLI_002235 [Neolecta irregularis DAH-3]|uniref:Uncharacterized protein n=1 Tax=Neolecta irregularis (strain DAH-3) TaxID=1198029 RepID=A0A1U7LRG9_NEOID|nr:hypothetical protein NEOLI_002235 [Neolecta irregularis DAH-3]|eukprot:OLL25219.1 hypothetical protein NEOLI_002235 [Neolecta irregularis DAH-3]